MLLLALLVLALAYWITRLGKPKDRRNEEERPAHTAPNDSGSEAMTPCSHCQVHIPESEAVRDAAGAPFCCDQHRRLGVARR
jgi:uncharacterized protein